MSWYDLIPDAQTIGRNVPSDMATRRENMPMMVGANPKIVYKE